MEELKKYRCHTSLKRVVVEARNPKEAREKLRCKECLGENLPAFLIDSRGWLEEIDCGWLEEVS